MILPVQGSEKLVTTCTNCTQEQNSLYVALGIEEFEAGYSIVSDATESIGVRRSITSSLWHVHTDYSLHNTFNVINASILDRRIDSYSSLVVMNPSNGHAKWHLRQPLSDLVSAYWKYQNNIFISFKLDTPSHNHHELTHCITKLGVWAPLAKATWYLSTPISSKEVFKSLLDHLNARDKLCVFDSLGHIATWQDETFSAALC